MATPVQVALDVPLFCPPCQRTSYRWWIQFDLEKEGIYNYRCVSCHDDLFFLHIKDSVVRVYDKTGKAVGFRTR
jgi:hypothetical protein